MDEPILPPMWEHAPDWQEQVEDWIRQELARLGQQVSGSLVQVQHRPWSVVLQVPTRAGNVYYKAVDPRFAYEVRLTHALASWQPDLVLAPLAIEGVQGWMLLPDGGELLREAVRSQHDPTAVGEMLPRYARMQMQVGGRSEELIGMGAPDRRLAHLPELYARLLEDEAVLRVGLENGLTADQLKRLQAMESRLVEMCDHLAAYSIPESIHHGDLNLSNVYYNPGHDPSERFRISDWGDCSVSHPFYSVRTVLVSLEYHMDWEDEDPRGAPFAEQYLQAWQAAAEWDALKAAYRLSRPLAALVGALAWQQGQTALPEVLRADYAHAVPSLLQEFLDLSG